MKTILIAVLIVLVAGIAFAFCYVDPTCKIQCERRCFSENPSGQCIQLCEKLCTQC